MSKYIKDPIETADGNISDFIGKFIYGRRIESIIIFPQVVTTIISHRDNGFIQG